MNLNPDPERQDRLLDVVLNDERWQTASAALKTQAMQEFQVRQRNRRLIRWSTGLSLATALILCLTQWSDRRPVPTPTNTAKLTTPTTTPAKRDSLTDEELLSLFPKGSCILAEIDGQKELVFLSAEDERKYLVKAPNP